MVNGVRDGSQRPEWCRLALSLHLLGYPEHPGVDVISELLRIGQGDDDIGLMTWFSLLAGFLKGGVYCHGVGQGKIAVGQADDVAVA